MFALRFLNAQSYFSLTKPPTAFVNYLIFVTSIFYYFKSSCIMNKIRSYDLDNLKVFLTVMVIFHHAGQAGLIVFGSSVRRIIGSGCSE